MTPALAATHALLTAAARPLSIREVAEQLGLNYFAANSRLYELVRAGHAEITHTVQNGRRANLYQPVDAGNGNSRYYVTRLTGFPIGEEPLDVLGRRHGLPTHVYQVLDRDHCHHVVASFDERYADRRGRAERLARRLNLAGGES